MSATSTAVRPDPSHRVYTGDALRAVTMPMGGIGTGTIALAGDGSLRQWQIHNQINHLACVPHSFFAIRAREDRPVPTPAVSRVLQSDALNDGEPVEAPSTSNDHVVPEAHRQLLDTLPGVEATTFSGAYPIANIAYTDEALPIDVSLESFSPFVPMDADESGIPVVCFNFTVRNPTDVPWRVSLAGTLQNAVGWDGVSPITGITCEHYGGNSNAVIRSGTSTTINMSNAWLPGDAAGNGTMALSVDAPDVTWLAQWDDLDAMWADFSSDGRFANHLDSTPSVRGRTWNGALAAGVTLAPGESRVIPFRIAWHFPNRYVNWNQRVFFHFHDTKSNLFIGNYYANRFASAIDASDYVVAHSDTLATATRKASEILHDSTLPRSLIGSAISPISIIRSPTCFRTEDGNFYGFEGCNGASTSHHAPTFGGSCPLNCTHVWNYEMSLSRLFPRLERTMRATEWQLQQRSDGSLPHRVLLPRYLPRKDSGPIGAPHNPAIDGLFGAILKTYREYLISGDKEWLDEMWPGVERALEHVWTEHDPERTGVIEDEQPNTYDISIYGANTFIGTLYLAALRAASKMATVVDPNSSFAETCLHVADRGREQIESRLWNGEYYIQDVDLDAHPEQNWATGCHIDHLLGQWWAWSLGLGDLLDPERLRSATQAMFRHNFREDFRDRNRKVRQYVTDEDRGTLICTWPNGGRPNVPTLYSDEVWTGLEYELAALLINTGHTDEAITVLDAVRERHDGTKQSPWNDIECGDHYVRAMSSWMVLEAATGFHYNAAERAMSFVPRLQDGDIRAPFVTESAWGTLSQDENGVTLEVRAGSLELATVTLSGTYSAAWIDDEDVAAVFGANGVTFGDVVKVREGQVLSIAS